MEMSERVMDERMPQPNCRSMAWMSIEIMSSTRLQKGQNVETEMMRLRSNSGAATPVPSYPHSQSEFSFMNSDSIKFLFVSSVRPAVAHFFSFTLTIMAVGSLQALRVPRQIASIFLAITNTSCIGYLFSMDIRAPAYAAGRPTDVFVKPALQQ